MMEPAKKSIIGERTQAMMAAQPNMVREVQMADSQAQILGIQLKELESQKLIPSPSVFQPSAATGPSIGAAQPATGPSITVGDFAANIANGSPGGTAQPTGDSPPPPPDPTAYPGLTLQQTIQNPTNDPTITIANRQRAMDVRGVNLDQMNAVQGQASDVTQRLADLRSYSADPYAADPGNYYANQSLASNPFSKGNPREIAGQLAADLLRQKAELEAKAKALRAAMYGPTVAGATAPVISNAAGSTPVTSFPTPTSTFSPPPRMTPAAALAGP
jgi:hypothetical protein